MTTTDSKSSNLWKKIKNSRVKEWIFVAILAALLCVLVVSIFKKEESEQTLSSISAQEQKLTEILQSIDGVGKVQVMIGEGEGEAVKVVVVCDGGKDLRVIMDVREAAASAVGTHENNVKIYVRENN